MGDPKRPGKVVIDGKGSGGNGVTINGADHVTVNGFTARNYGGYGFFAVNVDGYELTNLRAILTGIYGVYAFNSKGGEISHSSASWNNDGGFYIGQTPPQSKPERSLVTDVSSYDNVIGFSGTNMRYVTITKSKFFNNGVGIVPNALDSEKFAPPEDNVITDNDIFWNNFDYYHAAPFKRRAGATGDFTYPVGVGVVIFGGRRNRVENNRIYGNYLSGVLEVQQILLKQKDAQELVGNTVTNNQFGQGGADRNRRDLTYDGDGSGNCFAVNSGVATTEPADPAVFAPCGPDGTFSGANAFSAPTQTVVANWTLDADHETYWVKYPHAAKAGYTPLERYVKGQTPMVQPSR